jgi:serine phosphatase RsbU (regulator of sigma subunit)
LFTRERIHRHVQTTPGSLEEMGLALIHDVHEFLGGGAQTDDMCLVCLGRI